ncbi:MAG TPA: XrtA system polysaccharide deacetylase [Gammaproteobacteria bacterium]|nr:XrtA system polysaccharide deacetylase [Gammaproteobacteria bacterium]
MTAPIVNAMTVDVEDYFQVSALEPYIARRDWPAIPRRVEANTNRILDLFSKRPIKATFFVLGWVAERHPALVRRIAAEGHEVASHGYAHRRVTQQSPREFRDDVVRAKSILEDIVGEAVDGYRAPSYSIGAGTLWALDVLESSGYRYSSSVFPIRHDLYGMPEAPRFPFIPTTGGLLEIPVTTVRLGGRTLPCGGGGYFRLMPYESFRWALRRVNRDDRAAGVFYFHPWEIDPAQPRVRARLKSRFRHYVNLRRMEGKVARLLNDFSWDRMDRVFLNETTERYPAVVLGHADAVPMHA